MLNRRVHVLFDKDMWNMLVRLAKSQNISYGELIRRAVKEELEKNKELIVEKRSMSFNRLFKSSQK